jgi:hypothetical protein
MGKTKGKLIVDLDKCTSDIEGGCPAVFLDARKQTVSFIDKQSGRATISVEHYNKFIRLVTSGEIKEIVPLIRK